MSMLIDGELVGASDGGAFENVNPATEEVLGVAPDGTADDAVRALDAASRAFDTTSWSTDPDFRRRCLVQLQDALRKQADRIRDLVIAESGTPDFTTRITQLDGPIDYLSHYIDLLEHYPFERELPVKDIFGSPTRRTVRREAAGVVTAITPWNYPVYLNLAKASAALAAGCTVVLKPAPETPWSATELGRVVAEHTDIPPGVFNVLTTSSVEVAELLTSHPAVDHVTFTGSTATGRRVMAAAAPTIKRVTLELGGKSAAIVLDDADLAAAVGSVVFGVCVHAGQGCVLLTRLLVPQSRLAEAEELAVATLAGIPWGDPRDPSNIMGPVISARQRDRVLSYYDLGRAEARLLAGGGAPPGRGYFVEPTLFSDVDPASRLAQEEVFGPVLAIIPYSSEEEAIAIADGTPYGLSAGVFSADEERAMRVARRLRTGTVGVNGAQWFDPESPFGGYKQSGVGREWGTEGLEDFLEIKTIARP
ncbi:aldehyde dehydrogenase family protein [Cryptosporangium aurantiacum]|uniref:Aldehyde dehydrogenase (NAD+) n=1 Tax=Cryptosporangium aurantiacum TaxID=134849 RepID=A0A1M7RKB1_9ACTN|nr:aldehyde dehydrogenase family protein [Cryptosporangium aurantiacum]SHN46591.1 aldehyde dehydrogenase (NAD+) [Cryptosporangium aurantiacum]